MVPAAEPEILGQSSGAHEAGEWLRRAQRAAGAVVDIVRHPSHWELCRDYAPVKGSPHGKGESRTKLVLRRKTTEWWETYGPSIF